MSGTGLNAKYGQARPRCLGFGYGTSNGMYVMTFSDSSLPPVLPEDAAPLVAAVAGSVLLPGDAGYDDERAVWNLNHELVPAVISRPSRT